MKNQLPNTTKNNEGFTLIELLIAITIVAILSVIGFSIFSNIQKGARDSQRRIEVDALSKNIESTFDSAKRTYTYTEDQYIGDYPSTKAADPLKNGSDTREYCVQTSATTATITPPAVWSGAVVCPAGWFPFTDKTIAQPANNLCNATGTTAGSTGSCAVTAAGDNSVVNAAVGWSICASLEASTTVFCKSSLQH
jgi:prepilin-type N-terminal cleavage/methylation domain-containing protein